MTNDETTTERPEIGGQTEPQAAAAATARNQKDDDITSEEEPSTEEELDLSGLEGELAEAIPQDWPRGKKAACSRSALSLYREGIILVDPPCLDAVLAYAGRQPESTLQEVPGVGKTGVRALQELCEVAGADESAAGAEQAAGSAADDQASSVRQVESDADAGESPIRVIERGPITIEEGDGAEGVDSTITPVRDRASFRQRQGQAEDPASVRVVRTYETDIDAPTCEECSSDMTVSKTGRYVRHFRCLNEDCDYTAQRPR